MLVIPVAVQKDRGLWERDWEALISSNNVNARITAQAGRFSVFLFFYLCFEWRGGDPYVTLQNFSMKVTFAFFSLEKPVN